MAQALEKGFVLEGNLESSDVARIYRQNQPACRAGDLPKQIDLSGLGQTDSSVLALVLEWQSLAHAQNSTIEFRSPPKSLRVLAGLSQVADLLGWNSDTSDSTNGELP